MGRLAKHLFPNSIFVNGHDFYEWRFTIGLFTMANINIETTQEDDE